MGDMTDHLEWTQGNIPPISQFDMDILMGKACPYCNKPSALVDSAIIYGKSYGMIYLCKDCDAYCGVHKGTNKALGRLANRELREAKKQAHYYFDMIWKEPLKLMSRSDAYNGLSAWMNLHPDLTHIGMFDIDQCKDAIQFAKQMLNDNRRLDLDLGAPEPTPYFE